MLRSVSCTQPIRLHARASGVHLQVQHVGEVVRARTPQPVHNVPASWQTKSTRPIPIGATARVSDDRARQAH